MVGRCGSVGRKVDQTIGRSNRPSVGLFRSVDWPFVQFFGRSVSRDLPSDRRSVVLSALAVRSASRSGSGSVGRISSRFSPIARRLLKLLHSTGASWSQPAAGGKTCPAYLPLTRELSPSTDGQVLYRSASSVSSTDRPTNRPTYRPSIRATHRPADRPTDRPTDRSTESDRSALEPRPCNHDPRRPCPMICTLNSFSSSPSPSNICRPFQHPRKYFPSFPAAMSASQYFLNN